MNIVWIVFVCVVTVASTILSASVVVDLRRRHRRHAHAPRARAVQHFDGTYPPSTSVLSGCDCGDASTFRSCLIPGTWTLAEVGGNDRAAEELTRMMEKQA